MDKSVKYQDMWDAAVDLHTEGMPVKAPRLDLMLEALKDTHTFGSVMQGLYGFYEPEHFCPNSDDDIITCRCEALGIERRKGLDTIEQFALAFVMGELYDKRWDGSEWVGCTEAPGGIA